MSDDPAQQAERLQRQIATAAQEHWKALLTQGIVMIVLGLIAVLLPNVATLTIELMIGILFLAGGLIRLFTLARCRTAPGFWWSAALATLSVLLGVVLLAKPAQGAITLTMVLLAFFIVEGIVTIMVAVMVHRPLGNWGGSWGWTLLSGLVDLVLAYLIWRGWPASAAWAIGLLVGINMFFLGLSLAMTAIAARTMRHDG
jgi:uncharacterized membrane protein HdeD (DUF308 family)